MQVGTILITLKAAADHKSAVLTIHDSSTSSISKLDYTCDYRDNQYSVSVYSAGNLMGNFNMNVDPFEPGLYVKSLSPSASTITGPTNQIVPMDHPVYHFWYDNVYYDTALVGAKYKHPNCAYYSISTWQTVQITSGQQLNVWHINNYDSNSIIQLGPIAGGAAIGSVCGVAGAILGAVIGAVLGNSFGLALLDETGCLWVWMAKNFEWKFFGLGVPFGFNWVPKYFRIATYILWDDIGMIPL